MRVLVACEFSGVVRRAFRERGHDAWSCDLLPAEDGSPHHYQADVRGVLGDGWDLMIAHPPCTYLTNAGVRHLHEHCTSRNGNRTAIYGAKRMDAMKDAARFFMELFNAPVRRVAVENPPPHKYARAIIGRYHQLIQPWQFGHGERKATCLWLREVPPLVYSYISSGREPKLHMQSPSPERWKNRSRTYPGIAAAMAEQWGNL